ncbi:MAG: hypothetical protein OXI10_05375 [Gammaproteobacteria bacterium]|nr:hypothetical protein [Gammaproteobacteria bacterium]
MTTNSKRKSAIVELKALLEEDEDRPRTLFQELLQELLEMDGTNTAAEALRDGQGSHPAAQGGPPQDAVFARSLISPVTTVTGGLCYTGALSIVNKARNP